ncbi:unnamed protein product [Paramecium sonneborni]|uniref:Uncharacterized protein n=1 Tax=Paramecium sonneborni TaxID=65129 RepID=A0A8S1PUQ2_9CILI|nr:unnamed protein product [Paramecium sonneborni]
MNKFILFVLILINGELQKIYEEMIENFQGNNGWNIQHGQAQQEICNSKFVFGGLQSQTIISKVIPVPKHSYIKISLDIWSYEQLGQVKIYLDQNEVLKESQMEKCSENKNVIQAITSEFVHSGSSIIIVMNGDGQENENKWGFRNLVLMIEECPGLCQVCDYINVDDQCQKWIEFQNSWTSTHINFMGQDGWISLGGINGATNCGGVPLIGGYKKFGQRQGLRKIIKLVPHYKLRLNVLWAKIDSWDNEKGLILIDGKEVWSQSFNNNDGYGIKLCGNSEAKYLTLFKRIDLTVNHTGDQVQIDFLSTLDQGGDDESFGLRDLQLFYNPCSNSCDLCRGPEQKDCIKCSNNQLLQSFYGCQTQVAFHLLQANFYQDRFTNSEGWILKETKSNTMITICQQKTILGGNSVLGAEGIAEKRFIIPLHQKLRVQMTLYKIDSWDGEILIVEVDDQIIWQEQDYQPNDVSLCGSDFFDKIIYVDVVIQHNQSDTLLRIRSTLDEDAENESWGFRDFSLMFEVSELENMIIIFQKLLSLEIILIIISLL